MLLNTSRKGHSSSPLNEHWVNECEATQRLVEYEFKLGMQFQALGQFEKACVTLIHTVLIHAACILPNRNDAPSSAHVSQSRSIVCTCIPITTHRLQAIHHLDIALALSTEIKNTQLEGKSRGAYVHTMLSCIV